MAVLERVVAEQGGAAIRVDPEAEAAFLNDRVVNARRQAAAAVEGLVLEFRHLGAYELRFVRALSSDELRSLLGLLKDREQDPVATLDWVAQRADAWAAGHAHDEASLGPVARFWAERATTTATTCRERRDSTEEVPTDVR